MDHISPFFIVSDVKRAIAFYTGELGFEVRHSAPADAPFFAIVGRDEISIMLKSIDPDTKPAPNSSRHPWARWDAYIHVPDPHGLFETYYSNGVHFRQPLKDDEDGLCGFEIADADGYVLFFGRPTNPPAATEQPFADRSFAGTTFPDSPIAGKSFADSSIAAKSFADKSVAGKSFADRSVAPVFKTMSPQLLVSDLERSIGFYTGKLGFQLDFRYMDFYAGITRDDHSIHLKTAAQPAKTERTGEDLDITFALDEIEYMYQECLEQSIEIIQPLRNMPYGQEFYIADPDGNRLAFLKIN